MQVLAEGGRMAAVCMIGACGFILLCKAFFSPLSEEAVLPQLVQKVL